MSSELLTIHDLIKYTSSFGNFEKKRTSPKMPSRVNLSFMKEFLKVSHNFDKTFHIIHIAGTNGKGSLAHILSKLLWGSGYNPGLFTSPHLIKINERFICGQKTIDDETVLRNANHLISILPDIPVNPTFFDFITAMALLIFHEKKCDYVILETGLGGRLDSTNFAENSLALINTIDFDHKQWLGETLAEIAAEKAGIIKANCPVILGKQRKSVYPILQMAAESKNARLYQYQKNFYVSELKATDHGITFTYSSTNRECPMKVTPSLFSLHQSRNIAMALFTLEVLDIFPDQNNINACLKDDFMAGRFQRLSQWPDIIIDGAHNPHAIQSLIVNLRLRYSKKQNKALILSIRKDKDYTEMLASLLSFFDEVIVCKILSLQDDDNSMGVFNEAKRLHPWVRYAKNFEEAYSLVRPELKENDLLVITGSFYLAGEALDYFKLL